MTCDPPCVPEVSENPYLKNCYDWGGGCCKGVCNTYFCVEDETVCTNVQTFFVAQSNTGGDCNGDARVFCDDERGCAGAAE
ncbi:MAG: hypothetical protein AB7F50_03180 [Fimbriimonadaceae bacterium]